MRINSDKTEIRGTSVSTKSTLPGKIKSNHDSRVALFEMNAMKTKKFQIKHVTIAVYKMKLFESSS